MPSSGIRLRVFVPKEVMNAAGVRDNISHIMVQKTGPEIRKEFEKTTKTWDQRPIFRMEHFFGSNKMWIRVSTSDEKYRLVNVGSRPHMIRPRKSKMLRFQTGFKPKTKARLIGSFAGRKSGRYVARKQVYHPGFDAREFDATIADEYEETFSKDVQDAISEGIVHR